MTIAPPRPDTAAVPTAPPRPRTRAWPWMVLTVSGALYLVWKIGVAPPHFVDIAVYRAEARALWDGLDLYGPLPGVHGLTTYPPFAAIAFLPLLLVPSGAAGALSLMVNLGLVGCASYLSLRRLDGPVDLRLAVPLLAAAALWCEPVLANNDFGQVNLVVLCLVLWDFSLPEESRWRGVGIGLAAALKVTPGIFVGYLLVTRRWRAAVTSTLTLLATLVVSAAVVPGSTWAYWTHHLFDPARVGRLENSLNQSVRGWVVRATHTLDTGSVAPVLTVLVLVVGLAVAALCHRRLGDASGVLVAALTGLIASPISWTHHWVWCLPVLAFVWYEARLLVVPTLLVFWSHAVSLVPHGDHVELRLDAFQVAMSGWYVAYAAVFIAAQAWVATRSSSRAAEMSPVWPRATARRPSTNT